MRSLGRQVPSNMRSLGLKAQFHSREKNRIEENSILVGSSIHGNHDHFLPRGFEFSTLANKSGVLLWCFFLFLFDSDKRLKLRLSINRIQSCLSGRFPRRESSAVPVLPYWFSLCPLAYRFFLCRVVKCPRRKQKKNPNSTFVFGSAPFIEATP